MLENDIQSIAPTPLPLALLADDEQGIRTTGSRILVRAGFRVMTAADGVEAIDAFQRNAFKVAVVVIDYAMPRQTGIQALRRIHQIRETVPAILTTGYEKSGEILDYCESTQTLFLPKPYRPRELFEALRTVRSIC